MSDFYSGVCGSQHEYSNCMHSAMMMQGDRYCQLNMHQHAALQLQLNTKVFKLSFEYLNIYIA